MRYLVWVQKIKKRKKIQKIFSFSNDGKITIGINEILYKWEKDYRKLLENSMVEYIISGDFVKDVNETLNNWKRDYFIH